MSLADVNTIEGVQIDVTPSGGATTQRNYIAANVQVLVRWQGDTWMNPDGQNHINTRLRHLIFILQGSDIDQISNAGNKRGPGLLALDLEDPAGYAVELYPAENQATKFEVIAFEPGQREILRLENMARVDEDTIKCITKNKVSRSDVEWFRKY